MYDDKKVVKKSSPCVAKIIITHSRLLRGALKNSVSSSLISISGGEELFERTLEERERERERPRRRRKCRRFLFSRVVLRARSFLKKERIRERDTHTENEER